MAEMRRAVLFTGRPGYGSFIRYRAGVVLLTVWAEVLAAQAPLPMRDALPDSLPRTIRVLVLDEKNTPLLRAQLWEERWRPGRSIGGLRVATGDSTGGLMTLDSVAGPWVQVACAPAKTPAMVSHLILRLPVTALARTAPGDTLIIWTAAEACDRRPLTTEVGTWTGHYIPGFESSDFRICGDTTRKIWVKITPEAAHRAQRSWPKGGDAYYPRYFIRFHGRLRGPSSYGHLGVSDYELVADSVAFVRLAGPDDCAVADENR
jgi:hypothetical protein